MTAAVDTPIQTVANVAGYCPQRDFPYSNGDTNPSRQVALATKFCSLVPEICGSLVTRMAP